jgi:hypothetical protein
MHGRARGLLLLGGLGVPKRTTSDLERGDDSEATADKWYALLTRQHQQYINPSLTCSLQLDIAEMGLAGRLALSGIVDLYRVGSEWYQHVRHPILRRWRTWV